MSIQVPQLTECAPAQISWSGTGPFNVWVWTGSGGLGTKLTELGDTDDTSLSWTVDVSRGVTVQVAVRDSSGRAQNSEPRSIQAGSCPPNFRLKLGSGQQVTVASSSSQAPPPTPTSSSTGGPSSTNQQTTSRPSPTSSDDEHQHHGESSTSAASESSGETSRTNAILSSTMQTSRTATTTSSYSTETRSAGLSTVGDPLEQTDNASLSTTMTSTTESSTFQTSTPSRGSGDEGDVSSSASNDSSDSADVPLIAGIAGGIGALILLSLLLCVLLRLRSRRRAQEAEEGERYYREFYDTASLSSANILNGSHQPRGGGESWYRDRPEEYHVSDEKEAIAPWHVYAHPGRTAVTDNRQSMAPRHIIDPRELGRSVDRQSSVQSSRGKDQRRSKWRSSFSSIGSPWLTSPVLQTFRLGSRVPDPRSQRASISPGANAIASAGAGAGGAQAVGRNSGISREDHLGPSETLDDGKFEDLVMSPQSIRSAATEQSRFTLTPPAARVGDSIESVAAGSTSARRDLSPRASIRTMGTAIPPPDVSGSPPVKQPVPAPAPPSLALNTSNIRSSEPKSNTNNNTNTSPLSPSSNPFGGGSPAASDALTSPNPWQTYRPDTVTSEASFGDLQALRYLDDIGSDGGGEHSEAGDTTGEKGGGKVDERAPQLPRFSGKWSGWRSSGLYGDSSRAAGTEHFLGRAV